MKNRVGIILADYPLGVLSDITSMAMAIGEAGFAVDIFVDQYMYDNAKIDFHNKNIRVISIKTAYAKKGEFWMKRIFGFSLGGLYSFFVKNIINFNNLFYQKHSRHIKDPQSLKEKLIYRQKYFFPKGYKFTKNLEEHIGKDYACLIGIEPQGLIPATIVSIDKNIPVIYHNMELLLEKECIGREKKVLKDSERECNQRCFFTIIQDGNRAEYLIKDNQLDPQKVRLLSVSSREESYEKKTEYLYRKLNIPKNKSIIVYSGNLSPSTMSLEIAEAARKWKDEYVLVLHTWIKLSPRDKYANKVKKSADNKKVYLSTEFVPFQQLPELLSSAKIGLLFYQNLSPNFYETGSAANKLVEYLRVGLPVISIDFPSLKDKLEKNNCGVCVESPDLINAAISKIMGNYDYYSDNARNLYKKDYDFSENFKDILEEIKQLSKI